MSRTDEYLPTENEGKNKPLGKLVMVIDDSPTVSKIVEITLQRESFEVATYPDGVAAFQALSSGAVRIPDLVILDLGLPQMDGFEVARLFKNRPRLFAHTIIVILTRREGLLDQLKGRLAGAQAYLFKPCTQQELVSVVTSYLGVPLASP